jgi:ABC-type uncharacterized transport system auxiliary subunit
MENSMTRTMKLVLGAAALAALSACVEETTVATTPSLAEQGCLRDVSATTNNGDVAILESNFSEAGTEVIVGVGPDRARWRCIGYSDGATAGIQSLVDEGSL